MTSLALHETGEGGSKHLQYPPISNVPNQRLQAAVY